MESDELHFHSLMIILIFLYTQIPYSFCDNNHEVKYG